MVYCEAASYQILMLTWFTDTPHALRERALDAGAHAVAPLPRGVVHPRPRRVQRLVLRARVEVDRATPGLRRRAQLPGGAGAAVGAAEHGPDARGADLVQAGTPGRRRLAPRTGDPLTLPVDREVALREALRRAGVPVRHAPHRPLERDAVVAPAADQQRRVDVGRVHEVLG